MFYFAPNVYTIAMTMTNSSATTANLTTLLTPDSTAIEEGWLRFWFILYVGVIFSSCEQKQPRLQKKTIQVFVVASNFSLSR